MRHISACPKVFWSILLALGALLAPCARADLVWNPKTGWSIEGGALSGLSGNEAKDALYLMNKGRNSEEKKSYRNAAMSYEAVGKRFPNSIYAPEALYRAAHSRQSRKEYSRAFENYQLIILRYPNTRRFNEIIGEQYRIASALLDGGRDRMFWGTLPGPRSPEVAISYFETILGNAPYSDYAPLSLLNIARAHESRGDTLDAIDALDRMVNTYRRSLLVSDAYMRLAKAHASLVDGPDYDPTSARDAATYFQDFMSLYPSDPASQEADKGLADMNAMLAEGKMKMADFYYLKRNNLVAAKVLYNDAVTAYPESPVAKRAQARLDEIAIKSAAATALPGTTPADKPAPPKKRFWLF